MKRMTHRTPRLRISAALLGLFILSCLGNAPADDLTHNLIKIEELQARDGDAEAQLVLGARYEDGNGVPKDLKRAVYWYKQAANQGNSEAQYKMGTLYEQGRGVKRNAKTSRNWFAKAAANGHDRAKAKMLGDAQPAKPQTHAKASPPPRGKNTNTSSKSTQKTSTPKNSKQGKSQKASTQKTSNTPKSGTTQATQQASGKGSKNAESAKTNAAPLPGPQAAPVLLAQAPAEAPKKEKKKSMPNMREYVIASQWQRQGSTPAELLPSSLTRCLKSSESEIVCFSKEHKRVVADSELTYTTKATLGDFTDDGQFRIEYVYNVRKIKPAARKGPQSDPAGLRAESGWQRPALSMNCKAIDLTVLRCEREGWHIVDYVTH